MHCFLILVSVFAASAEILRFDIENSEVDTEWKTYKKSFRKEYQSNFEESLRRTQWERNLRYIQRHNYEADLGKHSYYLGVNQFTDLSNEEFKRRILRGSRNGTLEGPMFQQPNNIVLPDTVDWRTKGYVTPVKRQDACGCCWAFSATGSLEGQHFRKTGKLVSFSEQNLVDCAVTQGCSGGNAKTAFRYIIDNRGIDTEVSYPYEAKELMCRYRKANVGATMNSFRSIRKNSELQLQIAVGTIGPISVAIDASLRTFQHYKYGVFDDSRCSCVQLTHAVLVVGYGTMFGKEYWLVKNSWSRDWGQDGYIMMVRNKRNQCGIATDACFPIV